MGMGGCGGGGQKEALVNRIKNFQRMGDLQKELWHSYADTYLNGVRDPNRHQVPVLNEFCENHAVPLGGGGGGGPPMNSSMAMTPGGCGGGCNLPPPGDMND